LVLSLKDNPFQERHHTTKTRSSPPEEKVPEKEGRSSLTNKLGEEIVFEDWFSAPPGYVFLPSGNPFVTRRCRKKTEQKLYAVYRYQSRKWGAGHIGLFIPEEIVEEAKSEYEAKRTDADENLSRAIDKVFPNIHPADKRRLDALASTELVTCAPKSALRENWFRIYRYVLDRYTPFKFLTASYDMTKRKSEAIKEAHQEAQ
jgi:hypothetical protein